MRAFLQFVLISCLAVSALAGAQPVPPDAAAAVVAAAREALGGEKKLAAVRTVLATGRTRQVRGDNLVPIEFEIAIELPDKYVRKDEIPGAGKRPDADRLQRRHPVAVSGAIAPAGARRRAAPADTGADGGGGRTRLNTIKQDFARLMLGMFAGTSSAYPVTFTYVGKAEAPQGKADVLDVKGPAGPALSPGGCSSTPTRTCRS